MTKWIVECQDCDHRFTIGKKVGGKLGGALVGSTAGGATRNLMGVLAGAAMGALIGDWVDRNILPGCPECQGMLRIVDELTDYSDGDFGSALS